MADLGAIKDQIANDVERTNAEIEFFKQEKVKADLTDVLIVWAGKNSDTQYRQGMNEIAALILLVITNDSLPNPYQNATDSDLLESYCCLDQ